MQTIHERIDKDINRLKSLKSEIKCQPRLDKIKELTGQDFSECKLATLIKIEKIVDLL